MRLAFLSVDIMYASIRIHISETTRPKFAKFYLLVTYGHSSGSFFFWRHCDTLGLCTFGCAWLVMFAVAHRDQEYAYRRRKKHIGPFTLIEHCGVYTSWFNKGQYQTIGGVRYWWQKRNNIILKSNLSIQKWANLRLIYSSEGEKCFQLQGSFAPWPLTRGCASGPRWELRPRLPWHPLWARAFAMSPPTSWRSLRLWFVYIWIFMYMKKMQHRIATHSGTQLIPCRRSVCVCVCVCECSTTLLTRVVLCACLFTVITDRRSTLYLQSTEGGTVPKITP